MKVNVRTMTALALLATIALTIFVIENAIFSRTSKKRFAEMQIVFLFA